MNAMRKPPDRHLITDEVVTMPDRWGQEIPFRVRIWEGAHATPLVIVSQYVTPEVMWSGPSMMTCKLANFITSAMLGHPSCGMLYFEDEVDAEGNWHLCQCYFEYYGNAHRLRLFRPTRQPKPWEYAEYIIGGPVERQMQ